MVTSGALRKLLFDDDDGESGIPYTGAISMGFDDDRPRRIGVSLFKKKKKKPAKIRGRVASAISEKGSQRGQ